MIKNMEKISNKAKIKDDSLRFFGVYDRNGNILSVHKTKNKATRAKNGLVKYTGNTDYFTDYVLVN